MIGILFHVVFYPSKLLGYRWKDIQFPFEESVNLSFKNLVIISFHLTDDGATTPKLVSG